MYMEENLTISCEAVGCCWMPRHGK